MAVLSTNEEIATRFATYLKELYELFGLHGVPFGAPSDLPGLVDRLEQGGYFAEDVSSILRSIILREGGSLPQTELLEVLALAAAGPSLDPTVPEVQPAFRRLLTFVGTIARRPWNVPPGEALPAKPPAAPAPESQPEAAQFLPTTPPTNGHYPAAANGHVTGAAATNGHRFLAPRPEASESLDSELSSSPKFQPKPELELESEDHDVLPHDAYPPPRPSGGNPSWPLWIAAACAILGVLALILFDRTHSPENTPVVIVSPIPSATSPPTVGAAAAAQASTAASALAATRSLAQASKTNTISPFTPDHRSVPSHTASPVSGSAAPLASSQAAPIVRASTPFLAQPNTTATAAPGSPQTAQTQRATETPRTTQPETTTQAATRPASAPLEAASSAEIPAVARRAAIALPRERPGRDGFFQVSPGAMAAHLVHSTDPAYPMLARMTHVQGNVTLEAVISPGGEVVSTRAVDGPHLLRGAAASAVRQWLYRPFFVNGHPVYVSTTVTIAFNEHR